MKKIILFLLTVSIIFVGCSDDDEAGIIPEAGVLSGGPFTFTVDGIEDNVSGITLDNTGVAGTNSSYVVTDDLGNILGLPPTIEDLEAVDFDGAGVGVCLIWYIRYENDLVGLEEGMNTDDLTGTFDLSNSITVNRESIGAVLTGGPFNFIVDGEADNIPNDGITIENAGTPFDETGWIVTDTEGTILGLPGSFTGPDFDAAGSGICLVWYISYETGLSGLEVDMNTADLSGVYALSNAITVNRLDAPILTGGPFTFIIDGMADNIEDGAITVDGGFSVNDMSGWVITDESGTILGLPDSFTGPDFDGAGEGKCFVWYITYADDLMGLAMSNNVDDLTGTYELSNSITVNRVMAPAISGGPFNFIVDGEADNIAMGDITVDNSGTNLGTTGWIVTDEAGTILGLPGSFTGPDFDEAGAGTCLVWYITYETGLMGLEVNMSANDLEGVFALSNPLTVNRLDAPTLSGGPFNFTVGDGNADNLAEGAITMDGGFALEGQSSWVVTDDANNILGLPGDFTDVDFDDAGEGSCFVWYITYAEGLTGLAMGNNISDLDNAVYELSNSVEVIRENE